MKQGIDADVASMTQAEKTMLRYQYVMNSAKLSMGDFAKTADTWANVVKTLKQQFQALGGTIGTVFINAFKPALIALRNFMQHVLDFAKTVADALGAIFGWTIEVTAAGSTIDEDLGSAADSMGDIGSGAGDAADGLGNAAGNAADLAKKLSVLPFDELNQLAKDTGGGGSGSSGGSNGGSNGGSSGGGGMSGSGANAALARTESVLEKITSSISSLEELGAYISEALTNALMSIKWDEIYEKARGFGTGLAQFLNGLITPDLFSAIGHTIAGAINTVLNASDAFTDEFDFVNLGNSIAAGINQFARDVDLDLAVDAFLGWANGILDTMIAAIGKIQWSGIGTKISNSLKEGDFEGVAAKVGQLLTAKFQATGSFIGSIDWSGLGTKLGESINSFFSNLKLENVGASFATAGNAIVSFVGSAVSSVSFTDVGTNVANGINKVFSTFNFKDLATTTSNVATGILDFLIAAIEGVNWANVGKSIGDFFLGIKWGEVLGKSAQLIFDIGGALLAALLGAIGSLGEHALDLGSKMTSVLTDAFKDYDFDLLGSFIGDIGSEASAMITDVKIFASKVRQALDEMLLKFAQDHPTLASFLGIDETKLTLDIEAQIKKQSDLRDEKDKYLEESGRVTKAEDHTGGNTMIEAAAGIDEVDNQLGYKPPIESKANLADASVASAIMGANKPKLDAKANVNEADNALGYKPGLDAKATINEAQNKSGFTPSVSASAAFSTFDDKFGTRPAMTTIAWFNDYRANSATGWNKPHMGAIAWFNDSRANSATGWKKPHMTANAWFNESRANSATGWKKPSMAAKAKFNDWNATSSNGWSKPSMAAKAKFNSYSNDLGTPTISVKAKITSVSVSGALAGIKLITGYNGGIFKIGKGFQPFPSFASGGYPYGGQIFRARENGNPELVGTLKGSTAVMNNNQIVASVSDGVAKAISNIRFQMTGFRPPEVDVNALQGIIEYAVVSALANNATQRPIQNYVTVKMPNGEVLARAVDDGHRTLNYRSQAVAT